MQAKRAILCPRTSEKRLQDVSKTEVDLGELQRIREDDPSVANTNSVSRLGTKTARHHQLREMRLNGFESLPHRQ